MFLKGVMMILIGLTGIVVTIIWFIKPIRKKYRNDKKLFYKEKEITSYTNKIPNPAIFDNKEAESTVLLDEFSQDMEVEETVLLDDREIKM